MFFDPKNKCFQKNLQKSNICIHLRPLIILHICTVWSVFAACIKPGKDWSEDCRLINLSIRFLFPKLNTIFSFAAGLQSGLEKAERRV